MLLKPTRVGDPKVDKALEEIRDELRTSTKSYQQYLFGAASLTTSTSDRWLFPGFQDIAANSTERYQAVVRDGNLTKLVVTIRDGGDTAGQVTVRVRVNKKDTVLQVVMEQRASGVFVSRPGLSVPVKTGDLLGVVVRKSAAPATAQNVVTANVELEY